MIRALCRRASLLSIGSGAFAAEPVYKDLNRTFEERAADLVSRMTLEEKVAQLQNDAPAIPRLGVPAYEWWNEALHGVARAGAATVFPQAIGLAATFDVPLMTEVATAISDEGARQAPRVRRAAGSASATRGSPSGRPTSTSSAIRAGAAARKPTARIRSSPRAWASRSSRGCRATTRSTAKSTPPPSTSPCTAVPSTIVTSSTCIRATATCGKPICRRSGAGAGRQCRLGDGRVQPRERRIRLGESVAAAPTSCASSGASRATWFPTATRSKTSGNITRSWRRPKKPRRSA